MSIVFLSNKSLHYILQTLTDQFLHSNEIKLVLVLNIYAHIFTTEHI